MRKLVHSRFRLVAAALFAGLAAACSDATAPTAITTTAATESAAPGIHPVVAMTSLAGGETKVELRIKQVESDVAISGYQAELSFDAARLHFVRAEMPAGVSGAVDEVAPGRVRFAGATTDGIRSGALVTLVVSGGAPKAGDFSLKTEELVSGQDFKNVTSLLVGGDRPLSVVAVR